MRQIFKATERLFDVIMFFLFFVTFCAVMIQVVSRFIPSMVVPWTEEVTRLSFVYTICFGAPLAIKYGEFARVDIVFNFVSLKVRLLLECISMVLVTGFCLAIGITSLPLIELGQKQLSVYMQIPMYFAFASIPLCFLMSFISAIFKTVDAFRDFADPERVIKREQEAAEALSKQNQEEAQLIREAANILTKKDGGEE